MYEYILPEYNSTMICFLNIFIHISPHDNITLTSGDGIPSRSHQERKLISYFDF